MAVLGHVGAEEYRPGEKHAYYPLLGLFSPEARGLLEGLVPCTRAQMPRGHAELPHRNMLFPGQFTDDLNGFFAGVDDRAAVQVNLPPNHPWPALLRSTLQSRAA